MPVREQEFKDFIRGKGCRLTGERIRLLDGIRRQRGHFNVDLLLKGLRKQGLSVSRDTVYRNLPVLLEAGLIEESFKTSRDTYYESAFNKGHHDHLICRKCGRIVEFQDRQIEKAQQRAAKLKGFQLERHCHQLIGLCKKCMR